MFGQDDDKQNQNSTNNASTAPTPADPMLSASSDDNNPALPNDHSGFGAIANSSTSSDSEATPAPPSSSTPPSSSSSNSDDLLSIKQEALQQLTPLVSHLDQSPEEKFRTTMMMIQASDDQSLIKTAYEAAKDISDEKARAQALLDVVNEINYFTQQHQN